MAVKKVFISAVSDEFLAYREYLHRVLRSDAVEVDVQEYVKPDGRVTLENLDLYIRQCDLVVHLVGDMTGAEAMQPSVDAILRSCPDITRRFPPLKAALDDGVAISYTQWEAWLALYHETPRLLIARAEPTATDRGPDYVPSFTSRAAQQKHLERLKAVERFPGIKFTSPDNLAVQVLSSPAWNNATARENPVPQSRPISIAGLAAAALIAALTPITTDSLAGSLGLRLGLPLAVLIMAGCLSVLLFLRYYLILGEPGSSAYAALRSGLVDGGLPARLYSRWLRRWLDSVDRFFRDANHADRTLFPRAFGLRTPAPLWTALSFDRCLLLAVVYPVIAIFVIWAVTGHAGPAELALGLQPEVAGWRRGIFLAILIAQSLVRPSVLLSLVRNETIAAGLFVILAAVEFGAIFWVTGSKVAGFASVLCIDFALRWIDPQNDTNMQGIKTALLAVSLPLLALSFASSLGLPYLNLLLCGSVLYVAFGALDRMGEWRRLGLVLCVSAGALVIVATWTPQLASSLPAWSVNGPLVLFGSLLALLNAPFDWISLGLTRALLRRGLDLGGWWPYLLALADALLAGVVIVALVIVMVIGVDTFNFMTWLGGGEQVLPLNRLFDGLAADPAAPEFWWLYALLLSTMIPSLFNLFVGGTALARGMPGMAPMLLAMMPADRPMSDVDRALVALTLTLQIAAGVILSIAAQAFLAFVIIGYAMPRLGLGILDLARTFAALELPERVWSLFAGG